MIDVFEPESDEEWPYNASQYINGIKPTDLPGVFYQQGIDTPLINIQVPITVTENGIEKRLVIPVKTFASLVAVYGPKITDLASYEQADLKRRAHKIYKLAKAGA